MHVVEMLFGVWFLKVFGCVLRCVQCLVFRSYYVGPGAHPGRGWHPDTQKQTKRSNRDTTCGGCLGDWENTPFSKECFEDISKDIVLEVQNEKS